MDIDLREYYTMTEATKFIGYTLQYFRQHWREWGLQPIQVFGQNFYYKHDPLLLKLQEKARISRAEGRMERKQYALRP